ncbi:MAG TPA: DUF3426 domain-containing protein [Burkholderiales bacterium]|nr:DUF3426 domain-containing protein [Burkholderiales bacterium]
MSLSTRCPNCGTVFRVQPPQLSARGGKVRCGRCSSVFDGLAALVAQGGEPGDAPAQADSEPSPQLALFEAARKLPPVGGGDAANEDANAPGFMEEPPPARRRWGWGLAALALLAVLAAQGALYYRSELAVLVPQLRPQLAAACAILDCELRLPRRTKLMAIESSDLQADDRGENVIVLNAVIRNQAPFPQEYPALELTLTDERDQAVARRVLRPADYLSDASSGRIAQGIGAGADVSLRLFLDTDGLHAVGYRMYLFFL